MYHRFAKELETVQRAHGIGSTLDILKCDVRLATHFCRLQGDNVQDWAVGAA